MTMVEISDETLGNIKENLQEMKIDKSYLRIKGSVGWGGLSYNLVLDEPVDNDLVEEHNGLHFVIEKLIYESSKGFKVDSVKQDGQILYKITPNEESDDGGGCGSCSSCG